MCESDPSPPSLHLHKPFPSLHPRYQTQQTHIYTHTNQHTNTPTFTHTHTHTHTHTYTSSQTHPHPQTNTPTHHTHTSSQTHIIHAHNQSIPKSPQWYGDNHYYNYDTLCTDVRSFPNSRFVSEYGWQSFPSLRTLQPDSVPTDWSPYSDLMRHRQHHAQGTEQIESMLDRMFHPPNATDPTRRFDDFLYLGQVVQARCLRAQSEHYRRNRGNAHHCWGAIYWQLNSIWPAPTWSSLEYAHPARPADPACAADLAQPAHAHYKLLHHHVRHFFAPLLVSAAEYDPDLLEVSVSNDLASSLADLSLTHTLLQVFAYRSQSTSPLLEVHLPFEHTVAPFSSATVARLPTDLLLRQATCEDRNHCFVRLSLTNSSVPASSGVWSAVGSADSSGSFSPTHNYFYPGALRDAPLREGSADAVVSEFTPTTGAVRVRLTSLVHLFFVELSFDLDAVGCCCSVEFSVWLCFPVGFTQVSVPDTVPVSGVCRNHSL
jgi:hypothetical protein